MYKIILFWKDTLHVSDGLSVHHQEFKTVHTATGICQTDTAVHLLAGGIRCLVLVKMYGNDPRKLSVKIIRNSEVRINEFLLFSFPFLKIVFISWCSLTRKGS